MLRFLLLFALAACGFPSFTEVQTEVFDKSCVFSACHKGASPAGEMSLELDGYANIVNVASMQKPEKPRVKPGDPDGSYMMDKLQGMGVTGDSMPPGAMLSDDKIELVRAWIEAGALDN